MKVGQVSAVERGCESRQRRREEGCVRERNEVGRSGRRNGREAVMWDDRGWCERRWVGGDKLEMPQSGEWRAIASEEERVVASYLDGSSREGDVAPRIAQLANGQ